MQEFFREEAPKGECAGGPMALWRGDAGVRVKRGRRGASAEATRLASASWALPAASCRASSHEDQASELAHLLRRGHTLQLLLLLHLQADSNL